MSTLTKIDSFTVCKGRGYWELHAYPWGGSFHRFHEETTLKIKRVIETFTDGSPLKVICEYNGKDIGIQF